MTDLICAHEIEDAFAGLGDDELDEVGEVALDEVAIGEADGGVFEEGVEKEEEVDSLVEVDLGALLREAVPDVVAALLAVLDREGRHFLDRNEGTRQARNQRDELHSHLPRTASVVAQHSAYSGLTSNGSIVDAGRKPSNLISVCVFFVPRR